MITTAHIAIIAFILAICSGAGAIISLLIFFTGINYTVNVITLLGGVIMLILSYAFMYVSFAYNEKRKRENIDSVRYDEL